MKPDDELIHADVMTEKYPGWWQTAATLALDPDEALVGTSLLEEFAMIYVELNAPTNGLRFRVTRKGVMQDFVVRGKMAWTIKPLRRN